MPIYDYQGNEIDSGGGGGTVDLGAYKNNLNGKKWLCIGDSITTQSTSYRPIICNNFGIDAPRAGYSPYADGKHAGYTSGATSGFVDSANYISVVPNADIATIMLGTNDFNGVDSTGGSPLGTIYDLPSAQSASSFTFYGCYKGIIENIIATYGVIPIVLITPIQRSLNTGANGEGENGFGHSMKDYRDAIIKIGEWYSLPVVDLYAMSGFAIGHSPATSGYNGDGLHPGASFWHLASARIYYAMNEAIKKYTL